MVFAMAVSVHATDLPFSGTVRVLKDGKTYPGSNSDLSMANAAFVLGYTCSSDGNGNVVVTMPLKVIHKLGLSGYVKDGTTVSVGGSPVACEVVGEGPGGFYNDGEASLVFTLSEATFDANALADRIMFDVHFNILLSSGNHWIESHITPNADLYLQF